MLVYRGINRHRSVHRRKQKEKKNTYTTVDLPTGMWMVAVRACTWIYCVRAEEKKNLLLGSHMLACRHGWWWSVDAGGRRCACQRTRCEGRGWTQRVDADGGR